MSSKRRAHTNLLEYLETRSLCWKIKRTAKLLPQGKCRARPASAAILSVRCCSARQGGSSRIRVITSTPSSGALARLHYTRREWQADRRVIGLPGGYLVLVGSCDNGGDHRATQTAPAAEPCRAGTETGGQAGAGLAHSRRGCSRV